MGREKDWIIDLNKISKADEPLVGGKAARLALMLKAHYPVPAGFLLTVDAYDYFIHQTGLDRVIRLELERKSLDEMRWEELWDTALRIRTAFNSTPMPAKILAELNQKIKKFPASAVFVVRSSAPTEDSSQSSFAGIHESFMGVTGLKKIVESVRLVWASLWSDAALLYREEMCLDPAKSQMAVLIQTQHNGHPSGVAFGRDPRDFRRQQAVVEAVPGLCRDLVDGQVDPDRWILRRPSGKVLEWRAGQRQDRGRPLLSGNQLRKLYRLLTGVEEMCGWEADMEWTHKSDQFVLLQARPITHSTGPKKDKRSWYLSLRPNEYRIKDLKHKITKKLIPQLRWVGQQMAEEKLDTMSDLDLAQNILYRQKILNQWKKIYWDEFIPFAHGVRRLAMVYNDAVKPKDPYEFVGLFPTGTTLASQRNSKLQELSRSARAHPHIRRALRWGRQMGRRKNGSAWHYFSKALSRKAAESSFKKKLEHVWQNDFDLTYGSESIKGKPEILFTLILEMAGAPKKAGEKKKWVGGLRKKKRLERKFFRAFGMTRKAEAQEILETARISWTLRDDDNVLLGRVDSQLFRALNEGVKRLTTQNRWGRTAKVKTEHVKEIVKALQNKKYKYKFPETSTSRPIRTSETGPSGKPRQLIGQPVSPGVATGKVHKVGSADDMLLFKKGEVLVCDSIQPSMTHLVPLAEAVIERRGGMLMHGAIIARELGRPCVNGILELMNLLNDGEMVTVDGQLGIVTVGAPEFDLELR
jgi:pyruvate,water dikinase